MKLFNKVAIVGVGLIGGSLGLALKKKGLCERIIGVASHKKSIELAKRKRAIDSGSLNIDIIKDADLIILATPVNTILTLAPKIKKLVKKDAVVIDVGSTKEQISSRLSRIFENYIGCHPLAGSEKRGIKNASWDLFVNSLCIITPTKKTGNHAKAKIVNLWKQIGTKIIFITPAEHDRILSFISHLPHIIAFSLISSVPDDLLRFASGGLRDTTRIAGSEALLWRDIFLSNRKNLLKSIQQFENKLKGLKLVIQNKNAPALEKILKAAKSKREQLK